MFLATTLVVGKELVKDLYIVMKLKIGFNFKKTNVWKILETQVFEFSVKVY